MDIEQHGAIRDRLKAALEQSTKSQQATFKHMYAKGNMSASVSTIVDMMPVDKLDQTLKQLQQKKED